MFQQMMHEWAMLRLVRIIEEVTEHQIHSEEVSEHQSHRSHRSYHGGRNLDEIISWLLERFAREVSMEYLILPEKSEEEAEKLRAEGNKYYRKRNFEKALNLYNASIMVAPHPALAEKELDVFRAMENEVQDKYSVPLVNPAKYGTMDASGEALGKAFANRAAIMLELKLFDKCIENIDLAIDYGYPENLKCYLSERKQRCISAKEQAKRASSGGLRNEKTKNSNGFNGESPFLANLSAEPIALPNLQQSNPNFPALSRALNVLYTSDKGRGIYATQEIHPGEILAVDESFCMRLFEENLSTHCSTCGILCLTPLPCPGCCEVVFCSQLCRIKGLAKDHWLECKILKTLIHFGLQSRAASFKILRTFTFKQVKAMHRELEDEPKGTSGILGCNSDGNYLSSSYQSMFHLQEYMDGCSLEDLVTLCKQALRIAKFLQLSERFFIDDDGRPVAVTREDLIEATKMLVINFRKKLMNSFELTKKAGEAMYPTASLFNHSCFPCATRLSCRGHEIILALRPISPRQEITISYGEYFHNHEKHLRHRHLRRYCFTCSCEACVGDWPLLEHLPEKNFYCQKCLRPCSILSLCHTCPKQEKGGNQSTGLSDDETGTIRGLTACHTFNMYEIRKSRNKPSTAKDSVELCKAIEIAFKQSVMPCCMPLRLLGYLEEAADDGTLWSLSVEKTDVELQKDGRSNS